MSDWSIWSQQRVCQHFSQGKKKISNFLKSFFNFILKKKIINCWCRSISEIIKFSWIKINLNELINYHFSSFSVWVWRFVPGQDRLRRQKQVNAYIISFDLPCKLNSMFPVFYSTKKPFLIIIVCPRSLVHYHMVSIFKIGHTVYIRF